MMSMEEPSVLDYVKSKLLPWKHAELEIPPVAAAVEQDEERPTTTPEPVLPARRPAIAWPWRSLVALVLAFLGQRALEPPGREATTGLVFYLLAFGWLAWAFWRGEWTPSELPAEERASDPLTFNRFNLIVGIPLMIVAFLAFGGGQFTSFNLFLWFLAIVFMVGAFWLNATSLQAWSQRLTAFLTRPRWTLRINRWMLLLIGVAILAVFFRAYQIQQVPPEMNSDHAEKLLDVVDVLNGQWSIFFPRNTGREALQFYIIAATASLLGTGVSFLSMKIGTILAGLLTLPYIYLLGKEMGSRRIGLLAVAFAAVAYWPNVISRLALRFSLYPLFVAPALYYLLRGLRRSSRNDFILSGIFLGIGLHGYTPIRILPFVIVIAVGIYLLHRQSAGVRRQAVIYLGLLALISLVLFLPLLRYALQNPDIFSFRAFSRLGSIERPLPGPAPVIFLKNLWNAMVMFGWDNGEVWTVSIPHRPALDVVSAALFYLGFALLLYRYLRRRHWLDLFLLLSVPLLMLPSILSLAFPAENPVLSRTGGAIVPVFLIIGVCLDGLLAAFERINTPRGAMVGWGIAGVLLLLAGLQNYDLVFKQYYEEYQLSSWNTSEIGQVVRDFTDLTGNPDSAWVMGYPYWVDTRLVGINAGYPSKDYAMFANQLPSTLAVSGPKLFILKPEDQEGMLALRDLYPQGWLQSYASKVETKGFLMYLVPAQ